VKQVSNAVEWGDSLARVYLLQGKLQERAAYKRKSNCICILLAPHKYLLTYGLVFFFCFVSPSNRIGQTGTTPLSIPSSGLGFVLGGSFVPTRPIVKRQPPITSPFLVAA
jgi:hypothetical protein